MREGGEDRTKLEQDPIGRLVNVQPLHQLRVLRGDPHGTPAGVALVAGTGLDAQLPVVLDVHDHSAAFPRLLSNRDANKLLNRLQCLAVPPDQESHIVVVLLRFGWFRGGERLFRDVCL